MRRLSVLFLALLLAVAAAAPARAIEVRKVTGESGVTAWLVEDHTNPLITMRFAFRGGAATDPADKPGLARMASTLLDEGAGELTSQQFQTRLDELALTLRFEAGRDTFGGRLKTLTDHRDEAFRLLHLALTEPRFDAEPVERMRRALLAGLRRDSTDGADVAKRQLFAALFGEHGYAHLPDGTTAGIEAVTVADLERFVAERLARDVLYIGVAGDITPEELKRLLDSTFGDLPAEAAPRNVPDIAPRTTGETLVSSLDVPQATVYFAQKGVKRDDPDFYAAYVMNHILGAGSFNARLYAEVREKRGLAYSVGSYLYPFDHTALLVGQVATANAQVPETMAVIRDEWTRMRDDGVTADELADAKKYLTGSFPLRFSSSMAIARILVGMQLDDLGIDYLERRNGYIEAVTLDAVNRIAADLLAPDSLTWSIAGKPQGLESD